MVSKVPNLFKYFLFLKLTSVDSVTNEICHICVHKKHPAFLKSNCLTQ